MRCTSTMHGALAALVLLTACTTGARIITNRDLRSDFTVYRTYGFPSRLGTDQEEYGTLLSQYLESAAFRR